jgi:hypothetical protein
MRGLRDALLRRDPAGLGRATAITVGLLTTTAGYLVGSVQQQIERWKHSSSKQPSIAAASLEAE